MRLLFSILKYSKYIFIGLLITLLLLSSILAAGLFTHKGNKFIFNTLHKIEPNLTINIEKGSLFKTPTYQLIRWSDGHSLYEFNELSYEFDWDCLLEQVCLESLTLRSATIDIAESNEPEEPVDENAEPFVLNFPVGVNIEHLDINDIDVKVAGVEIVVDGIVLTANGSGNDITLDTIIKGLEVTLADSEAEPKTVQKKSSAPLTHLPAILDDQSLPEVVLPFNLNAKRLDVNGFKLIQNEQNILVIEQANSIFTYYGSAIDIAKLDVNFPEANIALKGDIDLSERYPMDLHTEVTVKTIKELNPANLLEGQVITMLNEGDLSNLHSDITLSALINASITNQIDLYTDNLPYQLNASWEKINWPLSGSPKFRVKEGEITSQGNLNDYSLNMNTQYVLDELPNGKVSLASKGDLQSISLSNLLVETLNGNLSLVGNLNWAKGIKWLGELNIQDIDFSEFNKDYPATLNGVVKQSVTLSSETEQPAWQFDLPVINLEGELLTHPLTINGKASGNEQTGFTIQHLNIDNEDNKITVNGHVAEKNDLTITLDINSLDNFSKDASGKINGNILVGGTIDEMEFNTDITASNISYLNNSLEALTVNGRSTLSHLPTANLKIAGQKIKASNQVIDSLSVNITPSKNTKEEVKHLIDFDLNSEALTTDLAINFTQQSDNWNAELNKAAIKSVQGTWLLNKPFTATVEQKNNQQQLHLTDHCWSATNEQQAENGKICINEFIAGETGNIDININDFLISTLAPFIPKELMLEGGLNADVNLLWKKDKKPVIDIQMDGKEIALNIKADETQENYVRYPVEEFNLSVKSDKEKANFSVNLNSENLINSHFKGYLTPYETTPKITAHLDLMMPNFDAFSVLLKDVQQLEGQLQMNVDITKNIENPDINGEILIVDTNVKANAAPLQINDLNSTIKFNQNNATLDGYFYTNTKVVEKDENGRILKGINLIKDTAVKAVNIPQRLANNRKVHEADGVNEGRADITGLFDWSEKFKGNVHFEAEQMRIRDYGKIDLYISPKLDLIFSDHISLEGELNVDKGTITVKELPAGAVSVSKDVVIVDAEDKEEASNLPIMMDLKVALGERLRVKAIGLDSYIHGNLLIKKSLQKDPTIHGELTFSEGSYRALAQELVLQESRITFQGSADSPYINIEAIRDPSSIEDNVVAGVRVTGTPDQLELTIFSEPAMSQQNALSYIMRGQSIENSSEDSHNQLASVLIDLGAGQTSGVMNNIGSKVGIDDLSLASSGQGDEQSVGIRGTIAPGVEVSYGVGVFDSFTIFALRYELFEKFYIEASSGLYQAVDAYYEWDWD